MDLRYVVSFISHPGSKVKNAHDLGLSVRLVLISE